MVIEMRMFPGFIGFISNCGVFGEREENCAYLNNFFGLQHVKNSALITVVVRTKLLTFEGFFLEGQADRAQLLTREPRNLNIRSGLFYVVKQKSV